MTNAKIQQNRHITESCYNKLVHTENEHRWVCSCWCACAMFVCVCMCVLNFRSQSACHFTIKPSSYLSSSNWRGRRMNRKSVWKRENRYFRRHETVPVQYVYTFMRIPLWQQYFGLNISISTIDQIFWWQRNYFHTVLQLCAIFRNIFGVSIYSNLWARLCQIMHNMLSILSVGLLHQIWAYWCLSKWCNRFLIPSNGVKARKKNVIK